MLRILPCLYIARTKKMGNGVFTAEPIKANTIIEVSPAIVMSNEERKLLDKTLLHDYIFEWGKKKKKCCMAMGYVPVYNHSYDSNCEYEMDFDAATISVVTVKDVAAGEELFINYNGTYNNAKAVWFDAK
ncbi:MAG: SET domain-containing protein-lysine N-methyltransferase [Chitinophagaceae bacterium]|nr:SET domain-containing protein-lysine N-methyltransferase [Chitinophagaceae bacterium]